ncbi:MAG: helix-turn-helix transcriptional regulator [Saprospiraceae bacterium]|nr:helix-turn-helix transcriptional regulator [Saprospiraceae bacterium]
MDNRNEVELLTNLQPNDIPTQEQLKTILKYVDNRIALLKSIIHLNPFPVAIWDNKGYFVAGNFGYQKLFTGTPPPEYSIFNDSVIQAWEIYSEFLKIKKGDILKFPPVPYNSHDVKPEYPDNPIWFETTITPLVNEANQIECYLFIYIDVTAKMQFEADNKQLSMEIIDSKMQLLEMLSQLEEKQKLMKSQATIAIKREITPLIDELIAKNEINQADIEALKLSLEKSPKIILLKSHLLDKCLTLTEIKVCELIYKEKTKKEISDSLQVDISTIYFHTKNIRKKLGLTNSDATISNYLQNI